MRLGSKLIGAAVAVGACMVFASAPAHAAVYVIESDANDFSMLNNGTTLSSDPVGFIGGSSSEAANVVYGFFLPRLAPGETVVSATLSVPLVSKAGSLSFNVDAYYVGGTAGTLHPYNDFFTGPDYPLRTKIAENLIQPLDPINQSYLSSDSSNSPMAQSLRSFYQVMSDYDGGVAALIHLVPDTATLPDSVAGYQVAMSEHPSLRPTLTVLTPEPGGLAMVGFGSLAWLTRRRRG